MQWDKGCFKSEIIMTTITQVSLTSYMRWKKESMTGEMIMKSITRSLLTS